MDFFAGTGDGLNETILSMIILNVALIWDYWTFTSTSSREAKMRSSLSFIGITIAVLSLVCALPAVVEQVESSVVTTWAFAYGAFLFSFAKLWDCCTASEEDGTIRIPIVNACLGLAFLSAGIGSLLLDFYPDTAWYCAIFTDILYLVGALIVTYRFSTF
jgi:hypothetical protein